MENKERTIQLGYKMRYCRNCINFSQDDMSDLLDIDYDQLVDYESGAETPNIFWSYRFAKMFKFELDDLVNEEFTVEDFAVKYTDSHFMNFPLSKVNYDYE